jgi:hypothetical protein
MCEVKVSLYRARRPLGLREVEAPTFSDIRLIDGGKVVRYSFLFEAESNPGPQCDWNDQVNFKKSTSSGIRTGDLPVCSIVPQPTTLPRAHFQCVPGVISPRVKRPGRQADHSPPTTPSWRSA